MLFFTYLYFYEFLLPFLYLFLLFFSFFEKSFGHQKSHVCLGYSNECYVKETSTTIATLIPIGWPIFASPYRMKIMLVNVFNRLSNFNSQLCAWMYVCIFHVSFMYVACTRLSKITSHTRQQPNRFSSGENILYLSSFTPNYSYFRYRFRNI